jgi:uncharacterized protein with PIN domain
MFEIIAGVILGAIASWTITHFYYRRSTNDWIVFAKKIDSILSKVEALNKHHALADEIENLANDARTLKKELHEKFDIFEELGGICPECGHPLEKIIDENGNISARCNNPPCIERMSSY